MRKTSGVWGQRPQDVRAILRREKSQLAHPTAHKTVLIVHHPQKHFRIIQPAKPLTAWPDILGSYSL